MIQNDLYTSCDTSEIDGNLFDVDPLYRNFDDTSILLDDIFNENVTLDDYHQPSRSDLDSETPYQTARSSKPQGFNNFNEPFDFLDTCTFYDPLASYSDEPNFSLHFNQSQASNRKTRAKHDLQPQLRENFFVFVPSIFTPNKQSISRNLIRIMLLNEKLRHIVHYYLSCSS